MYIDIINRIQEVLQKVKDLIRTNPSIREQEFYDVEKIEYEISSLKNEIRINEKLIKEDEKAVKKFQTINLWLSIGPTIVATLLTLYVFLYSFGCEHVVKL